jgi:hypothetical protein
MLLVELAFSQQTGMFVSSQRRDEATYSGDCSE